MKCISIARKLIITYKNGNAIGLHFFYKTLTIANENVLI